MSSEVSIERKILKNMQLKKALWGMFLLWPVLSEAQVPTEKTLLWEISAKGVTQPSYMFGTIHLICEKDLIISETFLQKFKATRQLYLELDMDDPSMLLQTFTGMKMKGGITLDSLLTPEEYVKLEKYFNAKSPLPLSTFRTTKPYLLTTMMLPPALMDCSTQASWELKLNQMAKENDMETLGLEQVSDQLAVFDAIPYKDQAKEVLKSIENEQASREEFNQLLEKYKQKDIDQLYKLSQGSSDMISNYESILLTNRNKNWIPVIEKAIKEKPSFFAVGAAHLGGKDGVIALLRKAGYTVKPVFEK